MFVPVRVAYVKRVCFGAYATVPIKRVLYCRAYFKRGIQPECGVQNEKCGVQTAKLWSPKLGCD